MVENPTSSEKSVPNMTTIEELQGVVAGLVGVVEQLTTNVLQVSQTVGQMAEVVPGQPQVNPSQVLRMLSIQLPSFR